MKISDTDKIVAATLAAAKASSAQHARPLDWVLEYERILKVMVRRGDKLEKAIASEDGDDDQTIG